MRVLILQGSPRKKGNTAHLARFMAQKAGEMGCDVTVLGVTDHDIKPCREYVVCEKRGYCPIHDEMETLVYPLIREAEVVVLASPVFFFGVTAQIKALIDRCQTFWARKYRLNLKDPLSSTRKGILVSVGATGGKRLFDGVHLTARYFFDAIDADFAGKLYFPNVEGPTEIKHDPTAPGKVGALLDEILAPMTHRKRIYFVDETGSGLAQMAAGLVRFFHGQKADAEAVCLHPGNRVEKWAVSAMAEKGMDIQFIRPQALDPRRTPPDVWVRMGENCKMDLFSGPCFHWDLSAPDHGEKAGDLMDRMEKKVHGLMNESGLFP